MSPCTARNAASVSAVFSEHLVEFHNRVLDQRRLDAGMADKAAAIVSKLKKDRFVARADRQYLGRGRQRRAIAHIDRDREGFRQMPAECVGHNAPGIIQSETQRRLLGRRRQPRY